MRRATAKKSESTPVTAEEKDIMHVLHKEHMLVSNLFFEFSQAKTNKQKRELVTKIIDELTAHAEVEQKSRRFLSLPRRRDASPLRKAR